MNIQRFNNAILELQNLIGDVFPALNPRRGGDSTIIKISNEMITFRRKNSLKYVTVKLMRKAYLNIPLDNQRLDIIFKNQVCKKTFFLQFLKYFDLAKVSGNGNPGNPFTVDFK